MNNFQLNLSSIVYILPIMQKSIPHKSNYQSKSEGKRKGYNYAVVGNSGQFQALELESEKRLVQTIPS